MGVLVGVVILLGMSLFAGLMMATAGGAIYPPLLQIAAPFVCHGEMAVESWRHSYKPGQVGIYRTWWCQPAGTGSREDVTIPAILVASLLYSGMAFVMASVTAGPLLWWLARRSQSVLGRLAAAVRGGEYAPPGPAGDGGLGLRAGDTGARGSVLDGDGPGSSRPVRPAERLRALQALVDEGLITRQEYEAKRARILSEL